MLRHGENSLHSSVGQEGRFCQAISPYFVPLLVGLICIIGGDGYESYFLDCVQ